jgi:serine/threonine-protein kinase RsbW
MRFRLDPRQRADEAGRAAWVDEVTEAVGREAARQGLDEDAIYYLSAALREALWNALDHGRNRRGEPWVDVDVGCECGRKLVVTVRDRGPGFNPRRVPDPCDPGHCERPRGRGLFFMRHFTDRVSFAFPPRGSLVRLEKRLPLTRAKRGSRKGRERKTAGA